MDIIIRNSSKEPIYKQIVNQIKAQIIEGKLKEGDALPSMRFLAKELKISVITTKRAYEELEKIGFIFSQAGKGSFVKEKNVDFIKEEYLKEIEYGLEKIILKSRLCNITIEEIEEILEKLDKEI